MSLRPFGLASGSSIASLELPHAIYFQGDEGHDEFTNMYVTVWSNLGALAFRRSYANPVKEFTR